MSTNQERVRELFNTARHLAVEDREAFLDKECGDDAVLRSEIESLLKYTPTAAPTRDTGTIAIGEKEVVDHRYETGDRIGAYEIVNELGEGGFGIVYYAKQHEPVVREVAIKVLHSKRCTDTFIQGFEAERQTLADMNHPGIAHFYDAGLTQHNQPFFVMEFVFGQPITDYCDEHRLTIELRLSLFADVCKAVQHAHNKGVIHRDLTPNNILVSEDEVGNPRAQIIDFGIARKTDEEAADVMGTLMYMSPEQATRDASVDTRSDIYTLGVVLYELLVGKPPLDAEMFEGAALHAQLNLVKEQDPPTPSTKLSGILNPDETSAIAEQRQENLVSLLKMLRRELDWIPRKALQKDPERRYETASEFADDISRYLNDEVVVAVPDSASYRFKKTIKRHKGVFSGAAVVVLILIVSVFYVSLQWRETEEQRVIAENANDETEEQKYFKNVIGAAPLDIVHLKKQLLDKAWVAAGSLPKDEMPFEWKYLKQKYDNSINSWEGNEIDAISECGDRQQFAIGLKDSIRVIDGVTGEEMQVVPRNENDRFDDELFKFSPDGSRIVFLNHSNKVRIWDIDKNELVCEIAVGEEQQGKSLIREIEFCNNNIFATLSYQKATVIAISDERVLYTVESDTNNPDINDIEFSNDKEMLAVAAKDGIGLYKVTTGELLLEIPGQKLITEDELEQLREEGKMGRGWFYDSKFGYREVFPANDVKKIVFSKDDSTLLGVNKNKYINEWDVKTGELLFDTDIVGELSPRKVGPQKAGHIVGPIFLSDGSLLAFRSGEEGFIRVWDIVRKKKLFDIKIPHYSFIKFSFSEDGGKLAVVTPSKTISIYDLKTGNEIEKHSLSDDITSYFLLYEDGSRLLISDRDNVYLLLSENVSKLHLAPEDNGDLFSSGGGVSISNDGKMLAAGCLRTDSSGWPEGSFVQLFDLERRKPICSFESPDNGPNAPSQTFSPDGRLLVVQWFSTLRVYETDTGVLRYESKIRNYLPGSAAGDNRLAFSKDSKRLYLLKNLVEMMVIDTVSWEELESPIAPNEKNNQVIYSILLSPNGKRLVIRLVASWESYKKKETTFVVYDIDEGKELANLRGHVWDKVPDRSVSMLFSLDGKRLITSGEDKIIRQWDMDSYNQISSLMTDSYVELLAIDSSYKVSGITNVANSSGVTVPAFWSELAGHELFSLEVDGLYDIVFSDNNEMLIGATRDALHIFDTNSNEFIHQQRNAAIERYARLEPMVEEWFEDTKGDGVMASRIFEQDVSQWNDSEQSTIRQIILKKSTKSLEELESKTTPISVIKERLRLNTELFGEDDLHSQKLALEIGERLYNNGEYEEAELLFRKWLDVSKDSRGKEVEPTIKLGFWLGISICKQGDQGDYAKAEDVLRHWLQISVDYIGEDYSYSIYIARWLGYSLFVQEEFAEAEYIFSKWLPISKTVLGHSDYSTETFKKYYGQTLFHQENYVMAEDIFKDLLERSLPMPGNFPGWWTPESVGHAQWLGATLFHLERYEDAKKFLKMWHARSKRVRKEDRTSVIWFITWLAKTCDALGNQEEAQKYREMLPTVEETEEVEAGTDG